MGLTYIQANKLLEDGSRVMQDKQKTLTRAAKFYHVVHLVSFGLISILTATLIALDSVGLTAKGDFQDAILMTSLVLQVTLAFVNGMQNVVGARSKSNKCSQISKDYFELNREIQLQIVSNSNSFDSDEISDTLFERLMYYSSEAQKINESEPLVVIPGHRKMSAVAIDAGHFRSREGNSYSENSV